MSNEQPTISNEEVKKVFESLEEVNTSKKLLEDAKTETENSNYEELGVIETSIPTTSMDISEEDLKKLGLDDDTIESIKDIDISNEPAYKAPTKETYSSILEEYGLSNEDATKVYDIVLEYSNNKDGKYYDKMPDQLKTMIDALRNTDQGKISKENATRVLLDSIINDAGFSSAIDEYNKEMSDLLLSSDTEMAKLFKESIDNLFDDESLAKLREENPKAAEEYESIINSFKDSRTFKKQIEYLDTISGKKLRKFASRYKSECAYFDKRFNNNEFGVKVFKLEKIESILKRLLSGYSGLEIQSFIVAISKSCYSLSPDNVADLAYVYRLVSNIATYEFINNISDDKSTELFNNIKTVLDKIHNLYVF